MRNSYAQDEPDHHHRLGRLPSQGDREGVGARVRDCRGHGGSALLLHRGQHHAGIPERNAHDHLLAADRHPVPVALSPSTPVDPSPIRPTAELEGSLGMTSKPTPFMVFTDVPRMRYSRTRAGSGHRSTRRRHRPSRSPRPRSRHMHAKPIIDLRFRSVHRSFLLINPTRGPRLRNVRHPAPERVRAPARCLRANPTSGRSADVPASSTA